MIISHKDHMPQVKALVDELYTRLTTDPDLDYADAIAAEYSRPGQRIEHHRVGDGIVSVIISPPHDGVPEHVTHLVYGDCTTAQIREDLIARGLESLPITTVYPSGAVFVPDVDPTDD